MNGGAYVLEPWEKPSAQLEALCASLYPRLAALESRERKRTATADEAYRCALYGLVAAIADVALRRVPGSEGLPVSFSAHAYTGGLSIKALAAIRDGLAQAGLIVVTNGYYDRECLGHSRVTRLKPTPQFTILAEYYGVSWRDVTRPPRQVLQLSRPDGEIGEPPDSVVRSEEIIRRLNDLNSCITLSLPPDSWKRVMARWQRSCHEASCEGDPLGDSAFCWTEAAVYLKRIFKYDWERGGRLYGGFWQNVPKAERQHFTINGEPTVELDYGGLHPAMLYAQEGMTLTSDPYIVPGYEHVPRQMGKRTLNRLLNGTWPACKAHPLARKDEDKDQFSTTPEFRQYVIAMRGRLAPVAKYLGTSYGLRLQKRDSDLAIRVLERCLDASVIVFPIHDSFIAKKADEELLYSVMKSEADSFLGVSLDIKGLL
ncbi:MAG: hypothetical protein ACM3YN_06995 [Parcubacteria group bacterium]